MKAHLVISIDSFELISADWKSSIQTFHRRRREQEDCCPSSQK
jgi:hypothetical protein